ncbi:MAG: hypothetical protein ACXWAV_03855 [Chthoniobacterales bacterium]
MSATARESLIILSCADDAKARRQIEDYAVTICEQTRKRGWKACAAWQEEKLNVRVQGGETEDMRAFLDPLVADAKEHGAASSILEEIEAAPLICHLDDAAIVWGTVVHARLTRDLLTSLPEGAYVASADRAGSIGRLGPFSVRAQQWQRAQFAGLEGGMSRVFWSSHDYEAFVRQPNESR